MARTAGVFKRGNKWWIRYSVGGEQIREPAKTTRKEEAIALLHKRQVEIHENRFFPERRHAELTINGLRTMWLEAAKHKKSITHDRQRFEAIVAHLGAKTTLTSLRAEQIDAMKQRLQATPTRYTPAGMQPATVNRHLALLRSALKLARARGHQHRDPMAGVKFLQENNRRERICSPEEFEKLCSASTGELHAAIVCAYYTAMRQGEIVGLRWQQVDLKHEFLNLSQSDTKEADSRKVPLVGPVAEVLGALPRSINGKVFSTRSDRLSKCFGLLVDKLEIDDLRFHDLRHTAATNLRRAGVDIFTMRALTGHRTIKMLERYNKIDEDDLKAAVKRLKIKRPK